jgi:hypothetical protein
VGLLLGRIIEESQRHCNLSLVWLLATELRVSLALLPYNIKIWDILDLGLRVKISLHPMARCGTTSVQVAHALLQVRLMKVCVGHTLQLHPELHDLILILPQELIPFILIHTRTVLDLLGPTRISNGAQSLLVALSTGADRGHHQCFCITPQRILE